MEDELAKLKAERLQEITPETLDRLNRFSQGRLLACKLPLIFVEDLPQEAIQDILVGEERIKENPAHYRLPTAENLVNAEAFENYLRSVINSKVSAMRHQIKFKPMAEIPERGPATMVKTPSPAQAAHQSDLKETFFRLLKQKTAPSDKPTVEEWHETFDHTDRIPVINGKRKSTFRVRQVARKIIESRKLLSA